MDGGLRGSDYQLITLISSRTPGEDNIILLDLNTTGYVRLLVGDFMIIHEKLIGGLGGSDYQLITLISSRTPGEDNIILLDLINTTRYVRLLVRDFTIIYEKLIMFAFAWGQGGVSKTLMSSYI